MIDPRNKRPTTQDILDDRHVKWLRTLRSQVQQEGLKVVSLERYYKGKTAMVLSERELEVLQLVSFGLSSVEIAERLHLSSHTITNHRKNMLARSRCGNLAELVRVAINENLL
ncbi:MAG: helix-turn-helix transcriptional regulator [Flavobacteriales bacterium]|nr:helix-turn-helix transcriptional regulator [Flavobacteriales bacterium]MCB9203711.1 helix-turn-helix transcriptional regulator [Flavobacteriales bacterium]